ncbi:response regulator [Bradyrhizobium sp. AS23.2]|uniref:response regulator n=1 Tax=Bradyrhizobium sp. AS23.2 TaxID=1680155 RepID=UPI001FD8ADB3|nr:response regulator [Bradyrhizobium sp. AS23.2]
MVHHSEAFLKDCRVLIVEDEYLIGDDLANALRTLGAHVIGPVTALVDAMSIEHDGFDVAVLDINLRGCSAFPVADDLMRDGKPFISTTGYGAENIPDRFQCGDGTNLTILRKSRLTLSSCVAKCRVSRHRHAG